VSVSHHIGKKKTSYPDSSYHDDYFHRLWHHWMKWVEQQEKNRMAWLAASLFFQACVLFPLTVLVNGMAGNSMALLMISIFSLVIMFAANLSQVPEKITIPCIFFSALIDLVIIITCLMEGLKTSRLFIR